MNSALAFVVGLLQAALSLLGFVQQHPELPQAQRDQAQQVAQQAIGQATQALATQSANQQIAGDSSMLVASVTIGSVPLAVNLSAKLPTSGSQGAIDFGDDSKQFQCPFDSGGDCSTSHIYAAPGAYSVKLIACHLRSYNGGCSGADYVAKTTSIVVSGGQQNISVAGMSKYTDSDFGFSFWYPSGWMVAKKYDANLQLNVISITDQSPEQNAVFLEEVVSADRSVKVGLSARSGVDETYYFDPNAHQWMYSSKVSGGSAYGAVTLAPADVSNNTMGGLHYFTGQRTFGQNIAVPLSAHNFVVSRVTGGTNTLPLMQTIVATDPSVATPVSADEQIKTIQAERDAYAGL